MGTVRAWLQLHRKASLAIGSLLACALVCLALWGVWNHYFPTRKTQQRSPRPTALPAELHPEQPHAPSAGLVTAAPTEGGAVSVDKPAGSSKEALAAASGSAGTPPPDSPASAASVSSASPTEARADNAATNTTGSSAPATPSAARTIVVESQGRAAALDVQTIMALQRQRAEKRLYDRVVALSSGGGSSLVTGLNLPPGPINVPATRTDESALGTLMGGRHPVDRVPSGVPGAAQTASTLPAEAPESALAPAQSVVRPSIRLVSVYARGDFLMAELLLPNGRRLDLEVNDDLLGYRVLRIDEGGLTLTGWSDKKGPVFLAIGKTLLH